jgi:putative lipoprotein
MPLPAGGNDMARSSRLKLGPIVLGVVIAGAGCAASDQPVMPELTGTSWRAETIMGGPVFDAQASTITFEPDGRVAGRGGCNRYFGTRTTQGDRLSLGSLGATKMACAESLMDQEARFFQALESAERWTIDPRGLLLIYSSGAEKPSLLVPFGG